MNEQKKTEKHWVWNCSDESLDKGQVSVMAILETFLALGLCYLLARYFEYSWWLLVTAFAAPIILLQSEESNDFGIRLLKRYWEGDKEGGVSLIESVIYFIIPASIIFTLYYWLGDDLTLLKHIVLISFLAAFGFFIPSLLVGFGNKDSTFNALHMSSFGAIFSLVIIGLNNCVSYVIDGFLISAILEITVSIVVSYSIAVVASSGISTIFTTYTSFEAPRINVRESLFTFVFFIPYMFGVSLRAAIIRTISTLSYPVSGINAIPSNWRRICWQMDMSYPAELLPKAAKINVYFSSRSINFRHSYHLHLWVLNIVLFLTWNFFALTWRWSLKATLWIWWPLILLIKKPFSTDSLSQIRQAVIPIVEDWWKWLWIPAAIIIPWLLSNYVPDIGKLMDVLPDHLDQPYDQLISYAVPPIDTLRYCAISLACVTTLVSWRKATKLKIHYPMLLGDETYSIDIDSSDDPKYKHLKRDFYRRAEVIAKIHTVRIVSFILLGYSYLLYFWYKWYPDVAGRFIADWLAPHL